MAVGINAYWAGIEAMFQTMVMAVDLKTMCAFFEECGNGDELVLPFPDVA
jgi:hypothetical protein